MAAGFMPYVACRLTAKNRDQLRKSYARQLSMGYLYTVYLYGIFIYTFIKRGWWRSTVVERRSLAGELSLSCARPAADG